MDSTLTNQSAVAAKIEDVSCEYSPQDYLDGRFWLVGVFGTLISLLSAFENLFICIVLCQKKQNFHSLFLYILLLALFDFLISAFYIPLMSMSVMADQFLEPIILNLWFSYMRPLITFCHISMTASAFLMVAASFERFCFTCWERGIAFVNRYRKHIAGTAIFLGFIAKISLYFEFHIVRVEKCVGTMVEYRLNMSELGGNYYYSLIWKVTMRNLISIWVPFLLLFCTNIVIINKLRKQEVEPVVQLKLNEVQKRRRVRTATRTLILVVATYLMANTLNVFITLWEYIDYDTLRDNYTGFYTYGVDLVSILTVLSGVFRPLIYLACMPQIRKDVIEILNKCASRNKSKNNRQNEKESFGINMVLIRISELLLKYPNFAPRTSMDSNITDETEKASGEVFL